MQIPGKRTAIFWQTAAIMCSPIPFVDFYFRSAGGLSDWDPKVTYYFDSFLFFLVFVCRIFLVVRTFLVFQKLFSSEAATISRITGTTITPTMPLRVYLSSTPKEVLYIMPTLYIMCIGYIHHSLEFSTNYWPTDRRCMEDWDQHNETLNRKFLKGTVDGVPDTDLEPGGWLNYEHPSSHTHPVLDNMHFTFNNLSTNCQMIGESEHPITVINSAWLHFVTMTTIGYGEYQVNTHAGRFLVVLSWAFGLIVNSFVLSGFIQALAISRSERFLLEKLDHKHIQKMRHNDAASLITHFIKYWLIVSKLNHTFLTAKERLIVERYDKLNGKQRRRSTIQDNVARTMSRKESSSTRLNSERDVDQVRPSVAFCAQPVASCLELCQPVLSTVLGSTDPVHGTTCTRQPYRQMSDETILSEGKRITEMDHGNYVRLRWKKFLVKRPYDLAIFRFRSTMKKLVTYKQKEVTLRLSD